MINNKNTKELKKLLFFAEEIRKSKVFTDGIDLIDKLIELDIELSYDIEYTPNKKLDIPLIELQKSWMERETFIINSIQNLTKGKDYEDIKKVLLKKLKDGDAKP